MQYKIIAKKNAGKITHELAKQKILESSDKDGKKLNKAKYILGSKSEAKARSKSKKK